MKKTNGLVVTLIVVLVFMVAAMSLVLKQNDRMTFMDELSGKTFTKNIRDSFEPFDSLGHRATANDILKYGSSLDLVFTATDSWYHNTIHRFTGSRWTHIGILYRDPVSNKLFVLEVGNVKWYKSLDGKTRTGLFKETFQKWIRLHAKEREILWSPFQSKTNGLSHVANFDMTSKMARFQELIVEHANHTLTENLHFISSIFKVPYKDKIAEENHKIPKQCTCAEFVSHVLQQLGILQKKYVPAFYSPTDLLFNESYIEGAYKKIIIINQYK